MDFWKSEYEDDGTRSLLTDMQEFVASPSLSSNSVEDNNCDNLVNDQVDIFKIRTSPKTTFLAKKRLRAYYSMNKFKLGNAKDEKNGVLMGKNPEKIQKPSFKKAKKTVYPDEAAKAVIRDIEMLKKAGYGYGPKGPSPALPPDIVLPSDPIIPMSLVQIHGESPAISMNSDLDEENVFRKREIKCRNIRKSDTYRRSASPKSKSENTGSRKDKRGYPANWTEYKEMHLNPQKDSALKSKLLKKTRENKFDLKKYFNFESAPVPIDAYKCHLKAGDAEWIPFSYLRCTSTKPQIIYSTNQRVTPPGFLSRQQLFSLIPRERQIIIGKLGKTSKLETPDNAFTPRKWYPKNWKKNDYSEAKLIEQSVGLSFLQSYSDDEDLLEDTTQEKIIEKAIGIIEESKKANFPNSKEELAIFKGITTLPLDRNQMSPSATPKNILDVWEEPAERRDVKGKTRIKKSNWDKTSAIALSFDKTPPIDDKEEGEVISEEDPGNREEDLNDIALDEYEKTKEELKQLEAALISSVDYVESVPIIKEVAAKNDRKKYKKKRRRPRDDKTTKSTDSKKKLKKWSEKREKISPVLEPLETEVEVSKKKKQKNKRRELKNKINKDRKRKGKKKKSKKKKIITISDGDEDFEKHSDLGSSLSKGKAKKVKTTQKTKKRRICEESAQNKGSTDVTQEDYEDDIKYFAARFDAERKLKGKTRHKTKANISLEDLTIHPKTDERVQKKKSKSDGGDSESQLLSELNRSKNEQKSKEESIKKHKDKERPCAETGKKNEVKVDLLKMNEDYLREQKKKGEGEPIMSKENNSSSVIDEDAQVKNVQTPIREVSPCQEKIKVCKISQKDDLVDTSCIVRTDEEEIIILKSVPSDTSSNKINVAESDTGNKLLPEADKLCSEKVKHERKRKRHQKKSDSGIAGIQMAVSETVSSKNVKKGKHSNSAELHKNSSWESDDELLNIDSLENNKPLDLGIPLNIKSFCRRDIESERNDLLNLADNLTADERGETEIKKSVDVEAINDLGSEVRTPTKKRRWDIKSSVSTAIIKSEKASKEENSDTGSTTGKCVTLENQYEEFIKAVSSAKESENRNFSVNNSSDSSIILIEDPTQLFKVNSNQSIDESSVSSLRMAMSDIDDSVTDLKQLSPMSVMEFTGIKIPFPPVKFEQIQPVPAPSPKLEALIDLNKPMINLSLSTNVTQNITLSLAPSLPSFSAPVTTSIDISKPSVEISAPLSNDTLSNMHCIPLPISKIPNGPLIEVDDVKFSQIPVVSYPAAESSNEEYANRKLVFTSLTLPSKKILDNSKLNLDDSDHDDQLTVEEIKRRKLKALIEDNRREALDEHHIKLPMFSVADAVRDTPSSRVDNYCRKTSPHRVPRREDISPRRGKRDKTSLVKRRETSPPSPPRRRSSPPRKRHSPGRRRNSPLRRSNSPRKRRNSMSPRRRRSPSPKKKRSYSPSRRNRSPSPRSKCLTASMEGRFDVSGGQRNSFGRAQRETSPLKRSVADSTISDDQLPRAEDFMEYISHKSRVTDQGYQSPKRLPLDVRISQVLGYQGPEQASVKKTSPVTSFYHNEAPQHHQPYQFSQEYSNIPSQVTTPTMRNVTNPRTAQSTYRQVGNMLQIVPTDDLTDIPMPSRTESSTKNYEFDFKLTSPLPAKKTFGPRSKILQVGNVLEIVPTEIVPTEMIPVPPVRTEIKVETIEESGIEQPSKSASLEKPSAEGSMLLKVAERRAERENRRQEREMRRKEKEKRRKEKEKARLAKLKVKTENMIKKALELEEDEYADSDALGEEPVQWPPVPIIISHSFSKEAGKSILVNSAVTRKFDDSFYLDEMKTNKVVQFADGIRPGEGTSPSAGEDLCSPPPPKKKLPKEKRYKKMKFGKKSGKKKVKVKVVKKSVSPLDDSDSDDILPPPSPPPGSPPPHIFPPRIKINPVNNVPAAYLASIIQTAQQQQQFQQHSQQQIQYQSNLYPPSINVLMAPPPLPQGHLSSTPSRVQSPHTASMLPALSPQTHYHPRLIAPPPPPPPLALRSTGHSRHY